MDPTRKRTLRRTKAPADSTVPKNYTAAQATTRSAQSYSGASVGGS